MPKENLVMLRKLRGFSQEEIAEKIDISRQAYGKWESGETISDIEKCALLAEVYGVTTDSLIREYKVEDTPLAPAPEGKYIFGTVAVSERRQIVIPKEAREMFGLTGGCRLVILGDEQEGLELIRADIFEKKTEYAMTIRQVVSELFLSGSRCYHVNFRIRKVGFVFHLTIQPVGSSLYLSVDRRCGCGGVPYGSLIEGN